MLVVYFSTGNKARPPSNTWHELLPEMFRHISGTGAIRIHRLSRTYRSTKECDHWWRRGHFADSIMWSNPMTEQLLQAPAMMIDLVRVWRNKQEAACALCSSLTKLSACVISKINRILTNTIYSHQQRTMCTKLVCWQINSFNNHNNLVNTFSVSRIWMTTVCHYIFTINIIIVRVLYLYSII